MKMMDSPFYQKIYPQEEDPNIYQRLPRSVPGSFDKLQQCDLQEHQDPSVIRFIGGSRGRACISLLHYLFSGFYEFQCQMNSS